MGTVRTVHPVSGTGRAEREQGRDRGRTAVRGRDIPSLPDPVKRRLQRLAGRRWTQDGAVLILSQETRSQARNRELARERLADLIRQALVAPKRRIATRPTLGSQRRRLKAKSVRGEVKSLRGKVEDE